MNEKTISIIIPTRGRPDHLRCLLDSFKATTKRPKSMEIVLVMDDDDNDSLKFTYDGFSIKRVVVKPGLNMGALNSAGYRVSRGKYIMLLNDDVVVQTHGWDEKVLETFNTFPDQIVLVHINDKIFGDKLCTFPFLSRRYCDISGSVCPPEYMRYRIDDHIYNIFNLLAILGQRRIVYMPDIVFAHTNRISKGKGYQRYHPVKYIHKADTELFNKLLPERKKIALNLMKHIVVHFDCEKTKIWENHLKAVTDSVTIRKPEYIRWNHTNQLLSSATTRVTVGIVSSNINTEYAQKCIRLVKKYTKNFDLIILDNNDGLNFNHPREMNRIISICQTEYLVLMDDDVFVGRGWLDGMLRCINPTVGVVTPLHKNCHGQLSYAGVVMSPDYSGHHSHVLAVPKKPEQIQSLCSAIILIDVSKCGHIRFNETYSKYFLDIDYGLRIWESGFQVVCSPFTTVTHIGGATLKHGSDLSNLLFEQQRRYYIKSWIDSGRFCTIENGIWHKAPGIVRIMEKVEGINSLFKYNEKESFNDFATRATKIFRAILEYPILKDYARQRSYGIVGNRPLHVDDTEIGRIVFLIGLCDVPVSAETFHPDSIFYADNSLKDCGPILVEEGYKGYNIIKQQRTFFSILQRDGEFKIERARAGRYRNLIEGDSVDEIKRLIDESGDSGGTNEFARKFFFFFKKRIFNFNKSDHSSKMTTG